MENQEVAVPQPGQPKSSVNVIFITIAIIVACFTGLISGVIITKILLTPSSSSPQEIKKQITEQKLSITPTITKLPISPLVSPFNQQIQENHMWVYIKNSNLYIFDGERNIEKGVTQDASSLIYYRQPQWVDNKTISFVRCILQDEKNIKPYECNLITREVETGKEKILFKKISQANGNDYQSGADFNYAWNHARTLIFYSIDPQVEREYHLFNTQSGIDTVLMTIPTTAGRGGSLKDDVSYLFSPDDSKLIINDTGLYPVFSSNEDKGTVFIFDLASKKIIFEKKEVLTTFTRWLNNSSVIALQNNGGSVFSLNLIQVLTGNIETILNKSDGFNLILLNNNRVIFSELNPNQGKGVLIKELNLSTKVVSEIGQNMIPFQAFNNSEIGVNIMTSCISDTCGMDAFNGVIVKEFGIYNLSTNSLTKIPLTIDSQTRVSEVDVW